MHTKFVYRLLYTLQLPAQGLQQCQRKAVSATSEHTAVTQDSVAKRSPSATLAVIIFMCWMCSNALFILCIFMIKQTRLKMSIVHTVETAQLLENDRKNSNCSLKFNILTFGTTLRWPWDNFLSCSWWPRHHDLFLNLTKCFLCLKLTRPSQQTVEY